MPAILTSPTGIFHISFVVPSRYVAVCEGGPIRGRQFGPQSLGLGLGWALLHPSGRFAHGVPEPLGARHSTARSERPGSSCAGGADNKFVNHYDWKVIGCSSACVRGGQAPAVPLALSTG